ncbi:hypothetical protein [Marinicella meishanensis]|uniref:hypothetical protein n=1 Tax=Marinicella meishanensis TaxID=2873263 RepID=UPI001CBFD658|nr:hypothetical protein [Marinicella sp. NBU2979]
MLVLLMICLQAQAQQVGVNSFPGMGLSGFHVFMALVILALVILAFAVLIIKWRIVGGVIVAMVIIGLMLLYKLALSI